MPKLQCKCDTILNLQEIPCSIEFRFISDIDFDKYHGTINVEDLYLNTKPFLKCPNCRRLWIYWNGYDADPEEYLPFSRSQQE